MNTELIKALEEWANNGNRTLEIKYKNRYGWVGWERQLEYWVYDYDFLVGKIIKDIKDIPTVYELNEIRKEQDKAEEENVFK